MDPTCSHFLNFYTAVIKTAEARALRVIRLYSKQQRRLSGVDRNSEERGEGAQCRQGQPEPD